jgi:predicted lipoprotein with Yx(FWY)xxD motif
MTTTGMTKPAALLAAALALAASGCGSSSSKSSSSSAAASPATTSTASSGVTRGYGGGASSASTTSAAPVSVTAKSSKLGLILAAGPKRKTVYLFENDTGSASSCSGGCASVWPPVTGTATAGAGAVSADLGTITRSDGTTQVTYKGHPLYFFARDGDAGDSYGEGLKSFGASWYVLTPSGRKVDNS